MIHQYPLFRKRRREMAGKRDMPEKFLSGGIIAYSENHSSMA
jgi:hypothetical protein